MGEAADVVAAERRAEQRVVLHQEPGTPLVVRVGLPLLEEHRHGPAVLPGVQDLVVPVRPLDQPHPDRRPAPLGPVGEGPQVALGLGQVRLDDDADVGPVAELGLDEHLAEDVEGQVLVGVLLHVDVDERAQLAAVRQDRPQPVQDALGRRLGVDRVELA